MLILGLVGGIASGKSAGRELPARSGRRRARCRPGRPRRAARAGGDRRSCADAGATAFSIRRARSAAGEVAKIVFAAGNEAERKFLEQLTHPRIEALLQQELDTIRNSPNPPPVVVLDAALLFEAGWDKLCDKILFVDAPRDIRLERAVARGWSTEQFAAREAAQMPLVEKARPLAHRHPQRPHARKHPRRRSASPGGIGSMGEPDS